MQILKNLFLVINLSLLITSPLISQTASGNIVGEVMEESTEEVMEFVSVKLYSSNSEFIAGAVTDKEGQFEFEAVPEGEYYVELTFIGFETLKTPPFKVEGGEVDLGEIIIKISDTILEDVEVVAEKSALNLAIDRKVYNVEKDITNATGTATDALQNIPSVTADINGQISLRGSSNVTFFINGRPSALMRKNSTAALQQIPASTIERIEVITNPSAKYRPDGIGGIINIVLKEASLEGINGTLIGNIGNLNRYNGSLSLNYGKENMNFFLTYGARYTETPRDDIEETINRDGFGVDLSTFDRIIEANQDRLSHVVNAGWTYDINDNNALEISGNYLLGNKDRVALTDAEFVDLVDASNNERFTTNRSLEEDEQEVEVGLTFEHQFDEDHTLTFEYVYADFFEKEANLFEQNFSTPSVLNLQSRNIIEVGGPTHEVSLEYAKPIGEETELELGYVGQFMEEEIILSGEDFKSQENTWVIDPLKTSQFVFNQNIHAFFATVGHTFEKFSFIAGLRAEQALVTSNLISADQEIPNDYFRLYPTLHLGYELGDEQEIQLSYSKRVNRADSDEQNPFAEYADLFTRDVGNPKLQPEMIHSLEFGYHLQKDNFSFLPSIYYRYKVDGFTEIVQIVDNTISETTFTNLDTDQSVGFEFILTGNVGDFLKLDFSSNLFYQQIDALSLGLSENKSAFSWDSKLGANISITKSTYAQINGYFRSSRITPQGTYDPIFFLNAGLRQDILKGKASLLLTVSDIFRTLDYDSIIDNSQLFQKTTYGRNNQIVYLGFIYHFGKNIQKKQKKLNFEDKIDAGKQAPEEG